MSAPRPLKNRFEEKVSYEPMSGCWLWVGTVDEKGYGQILLCDKPVSIGGSRKFLMAHRVSWALSYGEISGKLQIDHICHNKACVNPEHLRLASHAENRRNSLKPRNNTSGFKGVSWHRQAQKWRSSITVGKKHISLGLFHDPLEAYTTYCKAAKKYHLEFANFGEKC